MNWGTKLIIGMLLFMSFIVVLGVLMFRSETDALVEKDYYEKGLKYDEDYVRKVRVETDHAKPSISLRDKTLSITFHTESTGNVKMMRSANKELDRQVNFHTTNKNFNLDISGFAGGPWKLLISWQNEDGTRYLSEQEVILP
ncbi:MAG: nitrogen fixation protein FixH [Pedobacter sp.]|nr:MAG: nitrogen fixation protein FixH [Pedobacter sp.]